MRDVIVARGGAVLHDAFADRDMLRNKLIQDLVAWQSFHDCISQLLLIRIHQAAYSFGILVT